MGAEDAVCAVLCCEDFGRELLDNRESPELLETLLLPATRWVFWLEGPSSCGGGVSLERVEKTLRIDRALFVD